MKRLFFVLLTMAAFTGLSYAQQEAPVVVEEPAKENEVKEKAKKKNRRGRADRQQMYADLKKELNLSDAQATKFDEINKSFREEIQEVRANTEREQMREEMMALRERQQEEVKKILTSEQYARYVELQEEQRARRRERRNF